MHQIVYYLFTIFYRIPAEVKDNKLDKVRKIWENRQHK